MANIFTEGATNEGAVSWGAVFAGAVGAAALSLVLFVLGTGLGLAAVSPWSKEGISGSAVGVSTIVWITVVQLLASALGGYLAGRLRTRWVTVHSNEVFFRDTAHGFIAWAVSTLLMATLLSSAIGGVVSTGAKAGAAVASAAEPVGYYVDALLRAGPGSGAQPQAANKTAEVTRIFTHGLQSGELGAADTQYLAQLVSAESGLSPADAERRVNDTYAELMKSTQQARDKARQAADDARKASAFLALWLVISLFVGAFVASLTATFGGRLRDSAVLAHA